MISYWRLIRGCWTWVTTTIKEWAALPRVKIAAAVCSTAGAGIIVGGIIVGGHLPHTPAPMPDRMWHPVGELVPYQPAGAPSVWFGGMPPGPTWVKTGEPVHVVDEPASWLMFLPAVLGFLALGRLWRVTRP